MILLFTALLMVTGSGAALVSWWRAPGTARERHRVVEIASPYANTRSKVEYVGDSGCTQCHGKIAETYGPFPSEAIPEIMKVASELLDSEHVVA